MQATHRYDQRIAPRHIADALSPAVDLQHAYHEAPCAAPEHVSVRKAALE